MTVSINLDAHAAMLDAARAAHPFEACGLLFGTAERIDRATVATNVHPRPEHHFEIDPVALIAAHKGVRAGGPGLAGYWHSHPNGRDGPSAEDSAMAAGDRQLWVIVANGAISVWRDGEAGFERLSYSVRDM
jgi:proteasome lid subunit RPN8/RPN11